MLKLQAIEKDYVTANETVHALKGIDIAFRQCEFVSVLGPSGCGKTTLLNIIGGLDHYTKGDLVIEGKSTRQYKDRDWDTYRNHSIGFVFQSYNLIPHQTVLENVELALTIGGVDKATRIALAKDALDKVGLKDQYSKKPNQLSGGQCQRVAIARALVNKPEILLADEPTGALDTVTSLQIMELIKEIAKERLVIMVTHNPEIAEKYSTRIVKLLDGVVVSDSDPYDDRTEKELSVAPKKQISKKSRLSFMQAFRLSARNLKSKLKRTLMVCLAGSIGIIGVASVLAVSTGIRDYIRSMQDDMLSGNPITVSEQALDFSGIVESMTTANKANGIKKAKAEDGKINVTSLMEYLAERNDDLGSMRISNNITKEYIDYVYAMPKEYRSAISIIYGLDMSNNVYTGFGFTGKDGKPAKQNMSLSAARQIYTALLEQTEFKSFSSLVSTLTDGFLQMPGNEEFILSQYDVLNKGGHIPSKENEIMVVVNNLRELDDLSLAQLGYFSQEEFFNFVYKATETEETENKKYKPELDCKTFTYDKITEKKFYYYPNDTIFTENADPRTKEIMPFSYSPSSDKFEGGKELTITAILAPKDGLSYGCLSSGFYYTEALAKEAVQTGMESKIAKYMKDSDVTSITSPSISQTNGVTVMKMGITYPYSYYYDDDDDSTPDYFENKTGFVGSVSAMSSIMGFMSSGATQSNSMLSSARTLSLRNVGGNDIPYRISVYPTNFEYKDKVTEYLDAWNKKEQVISVNGVEIKDRENITYVDNLSVVIAMIGEMIDMITAALIAFTALSLVVSTVMIAIITYVSVIERVKEIGVIRSLGGRKGDVSRLFNAETFIIGLISGLTGIGITYLLELIANVVMKTAFDIAIVNLTIPTALIMVTVSVLLTLVSGLVPASLAAKKDPVDALRSE